MTSPLATTPDREACPTYVSAVQPTGRPHLGNYFGAIEQHLRLQDRAGERFYFIADYHALTTSKDPHRLREQVLELAVTYLALGLDPDRASLFRQSDVPVVCELAWLLSCVTPLGLLQRAVGYKDKVARGLPPTAGLLAYPTLMAADILAYDADLVPVGADQLQHVEMARDMADSFNRYFGDVFVRPEPLLSPRARLPGLDGQKMSKSYNNTLWIFESGKSLRRAVAGIVTDSRPPQAPKDPDRLLPCQLLEPFLDPGEMHELRERVRRGGPDGPGYGELKQRLVDAIETRFADARRRRAELLAAPAVVKGILHRGAVAARHRTRATRNRALSACGLR